MLAGREVDHRQLVGQRGEAVVGVGAAHEQRPAGPFQRAPQGGAVRHALAHVELLAAAPLRLAAAGYPHDGLIASRIERYARHTQAPVH